MATTRTFQDMLNEYLPNKMLAEELQKRDYLLSKVEKDENWKGGTIVVPFRGAHASSVAFGELTSESDVAESSFVRGEITTPVEVWGTLVFNHRDLQEHNGKIPESTFLKILPDEVEQFLDYMKQVVSVQLGTGPHFASVTDATDAATGILVVDKIDRFTIGQKFALDDGNSALQLCYVTAVNINTSAITVSATRGGAALDVSAYSVAQSARCYHPGVTDGAGAFTTFTSLRSVLLSAANGGDTAVHGKTKTAWPVLQAVNIDGSSISASNILDKLFDAWTTCRVKAKGTADTFLMSYKHLGSIMKLVEAQKGPYKVTKEASVSLYGWTEMEITGVKGTLKIVGILEWEDATIPLVDMSCMTFRTNGFFKKRKSPEGLEYHTIRATTGYKYLVDISLTGELEHRKPGQQAIIYGIPDYV